MRVHELVDEGLGHTSYLIDIGDGTAALVDPPRFPTEHEQLAEASELRIAWTFDTHSHADYVTGSPAVAARHGATFVAPAASNLETDHRAASDGDVIEIGCGLMMRAIATPGHTPDHHAFLLTAGDTPLVLFSGGSLMVGTVGRTDLAGRETAEPLARQMFRSIRRLMTLPEDVQVAPTHGAGSFCSAVGATARTTTVGAEQRGDLLSITDEDRFVEHLLATYGSFPGYFRRLPELNRRGPRPFDRVPDVARLTLDEFDRQVSAGAMIVDARPVRSFSEAHIPGSLSDALRPTFATWVGWLIEPDRPLVFVLEPGQDRADLVRQCLDVGQENLIGELDGGIGTWISDGRPVTSIPIVGPAALAPNVVDVRQANEYAGGHIPDADNVELADVAEMVLEAEVSFMCGHGERAMTAASVVTAHLPAAVVSVLDGGPDTWSTWSGRGLAVGS
jgi:hydroxyacylglutathione hydrolase